MASGRMKRQEPKNKNNNYQHRARRNRNASEQYPGFSPLAPCNWVQSSEGNLYTHLQNATPVGCLLYCFTVLLCSIPSPLYFKWESNLRKAREIPPIRLWGCRLPPWGESVRSPLWVGTAPVAFLVLRGETPPPTSKLSTLKPPCTNLTSLRWPEVIPSDVTSFGQQRHVTQ